MEKVMTTLAVVTLAVVKCPVLEHPEAPAGPPKLTPRQLRQVQAETLNAPRLRYSVLARALFKAMDLAYGRPRTIVQTVLNVPPPSSRQPVT
jgi:hypothetical protein